MPGAQVSDVLDARPALFDIPLTNEAKCGAAVLQLHRA